MSYDNKTQRRRFIPKDTFVLKGIFVPTSILILKGIFGSKVILIPKDIFVPIGRF